MCCGRLFLTCLANTRLPTVESHGWSQTRTSPRDCWSLSSIVVCEYCVQLVMLMWSTVDKTRRMTRLTELHTATVSFTSSSSWRHCTSWWRWLTGTGKLVDSSFAGCRHSCYEEKELGFLLVLPLRASKYYARRARYSPCQPGDLFS